MDQTLPALNWVQIVVQMGALGLLAYIVIKAPGVLQDMLRHLLTTISTRDDSERQARREASDRHNEAVQNINKDRSEQMDRQMAQFVGAIQQMSSDHRDALKSLSADFKTVITSMGEHCDKEVERIMGYIDRLESRQEILLRKETGANDRNKS